MSSHTPAAEVVVDAGAAVLPAPAPEPVIAPPPEVSVGEVRVLGCRGGARRRARDACDRPAAAMDAFSRAVAATQDCVAASSRPARAEYLLRYEWSKGRAAVEVRVSKKKPGPPPAERSRCAARIRDYFLQSVDREAAHAAAEYRWGLVSEYIPPIKRIK